MKFLRFAPLAAVLLIQPGLAQNNTLEAEASGLTTEFISRLQPQLKQALQAGGPVNAITVCSQQAPLIADSLSKDSGWMVKRVSLKARNASRAQPDNWEAAVLTQFDRRQAAGEDAAAIRYSETTPSHFRYMQAQGVQGVCLLCHGENPAAEVKAALEQYYPDDRATGYTQGQVRGAVSLSKQL